MNDIVWKDKEIFPHHKECGEQCGITNYDEWYCPKCDSVLSQATPEEIKKIVDTITTWVGTFKINPFSRREDEMAKENKEEAED